MTLLPDRFNLEGITSTQGTIRKALGDMRDVIAESIGLSGGNPQINGGDIKSVNSLGIRTSTLGTDAQIAGGLAITTSAAASQAVPAGDAYLDGLVRHKTSTGIKHVLYGLSTGTNEEYSLGIQANTTYIRTAGSFRVFKGGVYSATEGDAGTGGSQLLGATSTSFNYLTHKVWHEGNDGSGSGLDADLLDGISSGSFMRSDADTSTSGSLTVGGNITNSNGQTRTTFSRTLDNSSFNASAYVSISDGTTFPSIGLHRTGVSGIAIYHVGNNASNFLRFRSNAGHDAQVWHELNDGASSGLDADLLDGLQGSQFLRNDQAGSIAGNLSLSSSGILIQSASVGEKLSLHGAASAYKIGVQPSSLYFRTGSAFVFYKGGVHSDTQYDAGGGERVATYNGSSWDFSELLRAGPATGIGLGLGSNIFFENLAVNGAMRVRRNPSTDGGLVTIESGTTGRQFMIQTSTVRLGDTRLWRRDADGGQWLEMNYNGTTARMELKARDAGTGSWVVQTDHANTAGTASTLSGGIGISDISKAQASASGVAVWAVNQYAFGSPTSTGTATARAVVKIADVGRRWRGDDIAGATFTWDYLTGTGDPQIWVTTSDTDEIVGTWEGEDPAEPEFPGQPPIDNGYLIHVPDMAELLFPVFMPKLQQANKPAWLKYAKKHWKDVKDVETLFDAMVKDLFNDRNKAKTGYEDGMALADILNIDDGNEQYKEWRDMLILRTVSRVVEGNQALTLIPLLKKAFKADKKKRKFSLA